MQPKKNLLLILCIFAAIGVSYAVAFFYTNLRGAYPAYKKPPQDIRELLPAAGEPQITGAEEEPENNIPTPAENNTSFPLTLPDGFSISIFASNVPGARDITLGPDAHLWVSQPSAGVISRIPLAGDTEQKATIAISGLNKPHGIVFDYENPNILFVAEEEAVLAIDTANNMRKIKLIDLPKGGRHTTRSLLIGPDNRLYISIGSSCDVCYEKDPRHASIISIKKDGTDERTEATGLRNAVFMTTNYINGDIWITEMGRDQLGDNLPPDEINILARGADYGWPICYGDSIHDTSFDKNTYIQNPCTGKIAPHVELQAHSAPLGLAFVPEEGWPEDLWYNLIVAFHGSWNRTEPTGYSLARIKLNAEGEYLGTEPFITGWLTDDGALGRPVDIEIQPGGTMYISDDKAGVIYKVMRRATPSS